MTAKQLAALDLIKDSTNGVPVEMPKKYGSKFIVHPLTAEVLVKLGYGEWVRSPFVGGATHIKYTGKAIPSDGKPLIEVL